MADFEILRYPAPRELPVPRSKDFNCRTLNVCMLGEYPRTIVSGYEIHEVYWLNMHEWNRRDIEIISNYRPDWIDVDWSALNYGHGDVITLKVTRRTSEDVYMREFRNWAAYLKLRNNPKG